MATIPMKETREYAIFQFFAGSKDFKEVQQRVRLYNKKHPEGMLFTDPKEKKALQDGYKIFCAAIIKCGGTDKVDFEDAESMKALMKAFEDKLPLLSQKRLALDPKGATSAKMNIGYMISRHVENLLRHGKQELYGEEVGHTSRQVVVDSHRPLGRCEKNGQVWRGSPEYKTNLQRLRDRFFNGGK